MKKIVLILCLLFCAGMAPANEIDLEALEARAAAGDADAQSELGAYYYKLADYDNALRYYQQAYYTREAENREQADMSQGETLDYAEALEAYKESAEQGSVYGEMYYGLMLLGGMGTPQDIEAGLAWLEKSAAQGYAPAAESLMVRYFLGEEAPLDLVRVQDLMMRFPDTETAGLIRSVGAEAFRNAGLELPGVTGDAGGVSSGLAR